MDNNEYGDYIKQVEALGGVDAKKPLQDFYTLNKELIQFFNGINKQYENYLRLDSENNGNLLQSVLFKLYEAVPTLSKLKYHINTFDIDGTENDIQSKIQKHFDYIRQEMLISEVHSVFEELYQLTSSMEKVMTLELELKERKSLRSDFGAFYFGNSEGFRKRKEYCQHIENLEKIKRNG